jgi:hypothetical protein
MIKVRKIVPEKFRKPGQPIFTYEEQGINAANINYWRPYIADEEDGNPNLFTMVYFNGSNKGTVVAMKGADFIKACEEAVHKKKGAS